jgi:hypothetical protein
MDWQRSIRRRTSLFDTIQTYRAPRPEDNYGLEVRDLLKDKIKELVVYRCCTLLEEYKKRIGRDQMTQTINPAQRYRVSVFISCSHSS